jgi:uncharacterized protein with HEPN domain
MSKNLYTFLHQARAALPAVARYIDGRSFEDYESDDMLQAAVERRLEEAAEALNRLSDYDASIASQIPELKRVVSLRNILVHGYDNSGGRAVASNSSVWNVVRRLAPALLKHVEGPL